MDGQAFGSLKQPSTYKSEGFEKKVTYPHNTLGQEKHASSGVIK